MVASGSKDWIELFLDYTKGVPSPEIFRLWAAISTVAGALERRVWIVSVGEPLYPNLYTILVADPGRGKSVAIRQADNFLRAMPDIHMAPHDVTKASLIDALSKASQKKILNGTDLIEYASLNTCADEFGVLVPSHDLEFLSTLNRIFDNPDNHRHERRGLKEAIDIINPQMNIIAGTQPAYLSNLLPEEAWGMGFMSRVIMIYSSIKPRVRIFDKLTLNHTIKIELISALRKMTEMYGQLKWDIRAQEAIETWLDDGLSPVPEHSKMQHYNERRLLHVLKLSMISAVSAGHEHIYLTDVTRAKDWLLGAEQTMPDIFRAMVQRSDRQVMDEMHFFAWQIYVKDRTAIHEARMISFLSQRVPSEKIPRILDIAVRADIFDYNPESKTYRPRPRGDFSVE
jgi:hypothetical protein